jgi:prophage tail gpP-like protein
MIYTVRPGDTLDGIAIRLLGSKAPAPTLFQINRAQIKSGSPERLAAGERLVVPDQMIAAAKRASRKAPRDPNDVAVEVNGIEYGGWETIRIFRSLETASAAFDLGVTDKWQPGEEPWPIFDLDRVRVFVGADVLVDGYVDSVSYSLDGSSHGMTVSGRDRTADLIDCSAVARPGTFVNKRIEESARILAEPFGVEVVADVDTGAPIPKFTLMPGERVHEAIARAAIAKNLIVTVASGGRLALTRSGSRRAVDAIVEGRNLLRGDTSATSAERYSEYIVEGQAAGQGKAAMRATYRDPAVTRYRPLMLSAEQKASAEYLRSRAEYEARIRAARARGGTVVVSGWRQSDGRLWEPNRIVAARAPSLGLTEDLLIADVALDLSPGSGRTTTLRLVRPDAYVSELELDAERDALRQQRKGKKGKRGKKGQVSKAEMDEELRGIREEQVKGGF